MIYIDGNNVEGAMPTVRPGTPAAEQALLLKISTWVEHTGKAVTIVFDGIVPSPPRQGRLRILHPTPAEADADNAIINLLEADQHRREAIVVTSDNELQRRALALGASVIRAAEFLDQLPRDSHEAKPTIKGQADVEDWLHYFGLPPDGEKPKPAEPTTKNRLKRK